MIGLELDSDAPETNGESEHLESFAHELTITSPTSFSLYS